MKNKNVVIFVIFLIISILLLIWGFGLYSLASLPFQDLTLVPEHVLAKQAREVLLGKVMMIVGAVLLVGTIMMKVIRGRKNK